MPDLTLRECPRMSADFCAAFISSFVPSAPAEGTLLKIFAIRVVDTLCPNHLLECFAIRVDKSPRVRGDPDAQVKRYRGISNASLLMSIF